MKLEMLKARLLGQLVGRLVLLYTVLYCQNNSLVYKHSLAYRGMP